MRKNTWTMLLLVVAAAMVFGLAGCTQNGAANATSQPTAQSATATPAASNTQEPVEGEEPMEITWIVYNQFDNPVAEGTATQQIIEEQFNVKLTIPTLDVHNEEQWTLFWASGNTADRIESNNMATYYKKFADQDLIRPITEEMLMTYAPDWMQKMTSLMELDQIMPQITYEDDIWCMPYTNIAQAKVAFVMGARKSYMDAVGITQAPATLDEYHTMLYKFTKEDPDGDGVDNTYGLSGVNSGFVYVYSAYNTAKGMYWDIDGQIVFSSTQDEFKEALKVLNEWYDEGLIDPEFVTDDRATLRAKWAEGIYGVMPDHPWWWASSTADNVSAMVLKDNPGEELVFFGDVTGPDGSYHRYAGLPTTSNNGVYFGSETTDEKVQKIMAIENAFASEQELWMRLYYGSEGETYDMVDGVITPKSDILTAEKISELGIWQTFALIPTTETEFGLTTAKADMPAYDVSFQNVVIDRSRAFLTSGDNTAYNEKSADVNSVADEFFFNAITGKVDIDAEWENYLAALDTAGLQDILNGYESVVIRN